MFFVISPAKKMGEDRNYPLVKLSKPVFEKEAVKLIHILLGKTPLEIANMMKISDKLAVLNLHRYASFLLSKMEDSYPAIFLFQGDVYRGLKAKELNHMSLSYLEKHLGILSGLYGLLRSFDAIYPYRLEMGTRINHEEITHLYAYWGDKISNLITVQMETIKAKTLVNLASLEYAKAIRTEKFPYRIVTPLFKERDKKNNQYKVVGIYAKYARGLMVKFAAENQLREVDFLKSFNSEGYFFNERESIEDTWVFTRDS